MPQNTPSAQVLASTSRQPWLLLLGMLGFPGVPTASPLQVTLQTARLEKMSSLDGLESCLTLDLVLQTLCQTPPVSPPWNPCRGTRGQPSTRRIYAGAGGSPLSNAYAKPPEQQTMVTLGVTLVTFGDFLFPCTYRSEVRCSAGTIMCTAAFVYHAGAVPALGVSPVGSCPAILDTDVPPFVTATTRCCLSAC